MRIVALSPYVPYDGIDHAGGAYLTEHVRNVSRTHDVELFAPDLPENVRAQTLSQSLPARLVSVRPSPASRLVERWWNLRNFVRGLTPGWQVLQGFRADADVAAELSRADLVEIHWNYLLPLVPWIQRHAPGVPVSVFCHDVIGQSFERQARTAQSFPRRLKARALQTRVLRQERRQLNRVTVSYVFSHKDKTLLEQAGVTKPIRVMDPNLALPSGGPSRCDQPTALFVGAMHRPENVGGVVWFLERAWPSVLAAIPEARLVIAGANPPPHLTARASRNVQVLGYVADFDPIYRDASVFVVPLLAGAGLKFKVPQAMLYGLPVVATTIGAEGIDDEGGFAPLAAVNDEPAGFAAAVTALLSDPARARSEGARGREWAERVFSYDRSFRRLMRDYEVLGRRMPLPVIEQPSMPDATGR
jgi:glycosyltransferase involved in cell wall biosynthesis